MSCDEHFESSQETDAGTKSMSGFRRARVNQINGLQITKQKKSGKPPSVKQLRQEHFSK